MAMSASRLQSLLAESSVFRARVQMILLTVAASVLAETGKGAKHGKRANYAQQVIQNPPGMANAASLYLAQSTNVATTISMEDDGIRTSVDDAGLLSQITGDWEKLAAIDNGN